MRSLGVDQGGEIRSVGHPPVGGTPPSRLPPLRGRNTPIHTLTLDSPEGKKDFPELVTMTGSNRVSDDTVGVLGEKVRGSCGFR